MTERILEEEIKRSISRNSSLPILFDMDTYRMTSSARLVSGCLKARMKKAFWVLLVELALESVASFTALHARRNFQKNQ